MNEYEVRYISGFSLKFKIETVKAKSEEEAVDIVFGKEGHAFENRLISVESK